jgi:hypothetical protein
VSHKDVVADLFHLGPCSRTSCNDQIDFLWRAFLGKNLTQNELTKFSWSRYLLESVGQPLPEWRRRNRVTWCDAQSEIYNEHLIVPQDLEDLVSSPGSSEIANAK